MKKKKKKKCDEIKVSHDHTHAMFHSYSVFKCTFGEHIWSLTL